MINRLTYNKPFSKAWSTLLALLLMSSVAVFAQDDDDLEEVQGFTVVGSNIQRLDLETVNPVINITREALDSTGFSTVGDAIRALPIISGQSLVSIDAGTSFTPGVSSVNLRGLGNNNTLALLNGRRVVPFASPGFNGFQSVVDLNSIPSAAIESIQILKDGASAVYGSDAVAGVLAINLTKEYDGLTTQVNMGNTFGTDSFEWGMFAIGGATSGRMSLVYTVDFAKRNAMYARDIKWTETADGSPLGGFDQRSSANVSANIRGLNRTAYLFNPAGDPNDAANQRFPNGQASLRGIALENAFDSLPGPNFFPTVADFEAGNKFYNYQESAGMFPETREYGFYTRMTYAVTDTMDVYLETSFRRNETEIDAASTPLFSNNENGDSVNGTIHLPASNPYNPFGVDVLDIRWRLLDVGNRVNDVVADTPRIVAGLTGDLPLESWTFDSGFLFSESVITNRNAATVFDRQLQDALNGITLEGELLYANPWGRNDPRVLAYISNNNPTSDSFHLWSWDLKTQGDVVDLGDLGVVKAAVGVEYRYEEMQSVRTMSNVSGQIVGGGQSSSVFGDRDIKSLYAELSIPLTDMVEIQLAGRYEDYSDFGDTTKPKIGLKVKPLEGLLLRGAFGQSFRAPDLPFLHSTGSVSFTASFIPDPLRPGDSPQQIKTLGGGNINLQPEETDSYYLGLVLDMGKFLDKLDGLVFEVDLWRFKQEDVISRLTAAQIVSGSGEEFWDQFITRLPPAPGETVGVIQQVSTQWQNLDAQETQGVDLGAQYSFSTDTLGQFRFRIQSTYVDKFEFTNSFGSIVSLEGTYAQPKWRSNMSIAWNYGDWAAALFIDYVGEFEEQFLAPQKVKSYWRFNPQVAFSGLYDTTITVGVRNVFNEAPPVDTADTTTRAIGVHNIEPRFWYLRIAKDW